MTIDDRIVIEKGLDQKSSLRCIALQLGKDPTGWMKWSPLLSCRASLSSQMRKALRKTEQDLKSVNEQIRYTGQYLANKSVVSTKPTRNSAAMKKS